MNPGELNKKVSIIKMELVEDEIGGFGNEPQEVVVARPWANIRPISGKAYWEAQSERAKITHEIRIRYNPKVSRDMFVKHCGHKFVIQHIIDVDYRHEEMKLHCYEEV